MGRTEGHKSKIISLHMKEGRRREGGGQNAENSHIAASCKPDFFVDHENSAYETKKQDKNYTHLYCTGKGTSIGEPVSSKSTCPADP